MCGTKLSCHFYHRSVAFPGGEGNRRSNMPTEILKVITAAGFVAVPALAAWVGLDWYFTKNGKSTRAIFIAVAGFESAVLYSYLAWTEPAPSLIFIPIGWYLGLSVVAVAIYYGLYSIFDGKA